jgi:hypothetical protein
VVGQDKKLESGDRSLAESTEGKSGGEATKSQSRMINGHDNFVDKHRPGGAGNEDIEVFLDPLAGSQ